MKSKNNEIAPNDVIKEIVILTVKELKKQGLLNNYDDVAYSEVSRALKSHYIDNNPDIAAAIDVLRLDPYIDIIPLYYESECTIERIAEILDCDVSTVVRNKKRLCLEIYLKAF